MTETRAITQDIRPLRILLLNLMPTKVDTETQFARVLGNTPLQIELELVAAEKPCIEKYLAGAHAGVLQDV